MKYLLLLRYIKIDGQDGISCTKYGLIYSGSETEPSNQTKLMVDKHNSQKLVTEDVE